MATAQPKTIIHLQGLHDMIRTAWIGLFLAASMLGGCATAYKMTNPDIQATRAHMMDNPEQAKALEAALADNDIGKLLDAHSVVTLKLPASIALVKIERYASLADISSDELAAWNKLLPPNSRILGFQPISRLTAEREAPTLRDLRAAATKLNCELLLVYLRADSRVDNYNNLAAFYWTIAGIWLAPGDVVEHKTVMQAILVHTRTGTILGTATGDCHLTREIPMGFKGIAEDQLSVQTPAKALTDIQTGAANVLRQIEANYK
jgi:hypothetical protein